MGGTSVANATGSAFRRISPSGARISYLYRAPESTPGRNSSQMPAAPIARMGWTRPSQKLKSPTTETALAAGAQTANAVPRTPSSSST